MNTVQQVAGAIGTAVAVSISILSGGIDKYLNNSPVPTQPTELAKAMTFGSHNVFLFVMIIAMISLVISFFIRRGKVNREKMSLTN